MIVQGDPVVRWVVAATGGVISEHSAGIGEERDGRLIAGVMFEGYNGTNAFVHQRIDSAPSRAFWWTVADYGFRHLGCRRLTGAVPESNAAAVKLNQHIGFEFEARLRGASGPDEDMLIFVLWRERCRFLHWRLPHGQQK